MFDPEFQLDRARPATYNPRRLSPAAFASLRQSIRTVGVIKPIIVTEAGRIIAGHQRTRAMQAEGMTTCPAMILPEVSLEDEVRFNQLHNASDKEVTDGDLLVGRRLKCGWQVVAPDRIRVVARPGFASKFTEVLRLLAKHGEWGNAVATRSGKIIASKLYAHGCAILKVPLRLFVVEDSAEEQVLELLRREYGVFSYSHLDKTTWAQSLAQMFRIRNGRQAHGRSRTYERCVIPNLTRSMRVLDFGAGQKDYCRLLARQGFQISGVEFYLRKPGSMSLDMPTIHGDITRLCKRLRQGGLFDMVICDSVLNSVDSLQAEKDVLVTINALCKPGSWIVFSGRSREFTDAIENKLRKSLNVIKKGVYFVDRHGFSAMYQRGVWLYQKFHTRNQAQALARRFIGPEFTFTCLKSSWCVIGRKSVELADPTPSLVREFNLPLPDGSRINRASDILAAWRPAKLRAIRARRAILETPIKQPSNARNSSIERGSRSSGINRAQCKVRAGITQKSRLVQSRLSAVRRDVNRESSSR
jgi:ParB family chromosome partitioning protein